MIKLIDIKKNYTLGDQKIQVLKGINLEINTGEFVSIMGPSGSGKSTLMNIIGMLDIASEGKYYLNNFEISGKSEDKLSKFRSDNIGFIFQSYNLIPRITVLKQVLLPLIYKRISSKLREKIAIDALQRVGLLDKLKSKPNELSGGQQQRVSIARAIVSNPNFILADEPTGALDSTNSKEIMELLQTINLDGKTIILITHEKEIEQYAKRHIYIRDGLLVDDF